MKDSCHTRWVRVAMDLVKAYLHMDTVGADRIVRDGTASVFVCNHGAVIGPMAGVIYLPVPFRPWINVSMTDAALAEKTMARTYEGRRFLLLDGKAKARFIHRVSGLVAGAMNAFDPIPVSREDRTAMLATLKESVRTLEKGINLLIFPENPGEGKYRDDSFRDLHPVFAVLGRLFHAATGVCLRFYPVFADAVRHTFEIGAPVTYSPEGDAKAETQRIVDEVRDALVRMSS